MADSLRDQLVKAGLATTTQAKKAQRQVEADQRARRSGQPANAEKDPQGEGKGKGKGKGKKNSRPAQETQSAQARARQRARELNAQKLERDRSLAAQRNEKAAARALRAEIKQLILKNDQRSSEAKDDDVPYNFVHGKKIKRIYIPKVQREQLSAGSLVIVNNDGRYHLVSREVADKLAERNPKSIIAAHDNSQPEPGSDDEYYQKFNVPDDLDW
jgi:hypothetical protein